RTLGGAVVTALAAFIVAAAAPPVVVDGTRLPAGSTMVVRDKVYVALRPVGEALGAQVSYDGKARQVTVTTVLRQIILRIGDPVAAINGQRQPLDAPALVIGGRVALPLRALGRALGASVRYDMGAREVVVFTKGEAAPLSRTPAMPRVSGANTLEGTITDVQLNQSPQTVQIDVNGASYNISVPDGTRIAFRDTHGGMASEGSLSQVRPGDTLIATLDSAGRLISISDIFSGFNGTIASVAGTSMVLTNGKVVIGDASATSVTLDATPSSFGNLRSGDLVTVRADPRSGKVRDIVALRPGGFATSASATTSPGSTEALRIENVWYDASRAFRAGQVVHISATGTPRASAFFDLSNVLVGNAMREVSSGRYEGDYPVQVGTNLIDIPLIVRLNKGSLSAQAQARDPLTVITTPPSVKDTAPAPSARINSTQPNIYATFSTPGDKGMDIGSLRMTVNGRDVSAEATKTPQFISYFPRSTVTPGRINVEVRGADLAGNPVSFRWSFVVATK
ncbi:MAG: copper amine oxidase N-terminal domain-containing protein, partial [Candidatus Eremiobacteraeota bacterium]|nr:copper amine oxidase N-terminal domain-containing protein [Candidatus Eremiobacteraeota bacterium]